MIYLVISEEYDAEPHANTRTWRTVSAQFDTEEEADACADRLRDLCRGRTFQGPIFVQSCEETGRNFIGWTWPIKS